jgi:hypothetical protein
LSDEDPDYVPYQGIEETLTEMGIDLSMPMYNVAGQRVNASYKGIVIQNGRKFLLY